MITLKTQTETHVIWTEALAQSDLCLHEASVVHASIHNLERLYEHEVVPALKYLHGVMAPGADLHIQVFDLEEAIDNLEVLLGNPGRIYGTIHHPRRFGFTKSSLRRLVEYAGFFVTDLYYLYLGSERYIELKAAR